MDSDNEHPLDRDLNQMSQNYEVGGRKMPVIVESPSIGEERNSQHNRDTSMEDQPGNDPVSSRNIMTVSQKKSKTSTQLQKFEEEKMPSFDSGRQHVEMNDLAAGKVLKD